MKTGLGLHRKFRMFYSYLNLFRFGLRKIFLGFDVANIFIQRVDKHSLQLILRKYGAAIGESCDIESGQIFHNCSDYSNLTIGDNCHIGKCCFFDLRDKVTISNNAVISMNVTFLTHLDVGKSPLSDKFPPSSEPIQVGYGAYIGANSSVLMGVSVGSKSFIAAGSVVKDPVYDNVLVAGVPARNIRLLEGKQ
jgi:acetyltransferase-like isoleucine patch superfamily enzyme